MLSDASLMSIVRTNENISRARQRRHSWIYRRRRRTERDGRMIFRLRGWTQRDGRETSHTM